MLKKTLIGTAAASFIAAGALAVTTSSASASGIYVSGPNFSFGIHSPGYFPPPPPPRQICQPVFKQVQWWKWGRLYTSAIKVGEKCYWTGGNPGPFPPRPHQFPKPGPWMGPNPGWGGGQYSW